MSEEREETEEESPEFDEVDDDDVDVDDNDDDNDDNVVVVVVKEVEIEDSPGKEEVGGEVDVTGGREGTDVGLFKQTSFGPGLTVIGEVALPRPAESERRITTLVPAGIVTMLQVNEVPLMLVKAATTGPSALPPVWKERLNGGSPVVVSYSTVKGPQEVIADGGTTWNAVTTEAKKERAASTKNFMTGA